VSRSIEVYLGDYVDRGPYSGDTLDLLIERSRIRESMLLKGNHEAYLLEVLRDPTKLEDWRQFGGMETLMSYVIQPSLNPDAAEQIELIRKLIKAMPGRHLKFLRSLTPSFVCGDFFFVHAACGRGFPLTSNTSRTCCGYAMISWIAKKISANSSCTVTSQFESQTFGRTG
jgi:serine/threonine protein phosphatase 1